MTEPSHWEFHLEADAALNPGRRRSEPGSPLLRFAGGGAVLRSAEMKVVGTYALPLGFVAGSTEAEFLAALRGMEIARVKHRPSSLRVRSDCLALVRAMTGEVSVRAPRLVPIFERLRGEAARWGRVEFRWSKSSHAFERQAGVPTADALARRAACLEDR